MYALYLGSSKRNFDSFNRNYLLSVVYTNKRNSEKLFLFNILGNCTEINETKLQRFKVFLEFLTDLRIENSSNSY